MGILSRYAKHLERWGRRVGQPISGTSRLFLDDGLMHQLNTRNIPSEIAKSGQLKGLVTINEFLVCKVRIIFCQGRTNTIWTYKNSWNRLYDNQYLYTNVVRILMDPFNFFEKYTACIKLEGWERGTLMLTKEEPGKGGRPPLATTETFTDPALLRLFCEYRMGEEGADGFFFDCLQEHSSLFERE